MPINISNVKPREEGVIKISCQFKDLTGVAAAPKTVKYSLMDRVGAIVNDRQDVAISSPESEIIIGLHGDDLKLGGHGSDRLLLIEWTFDDPDIGSNIPDSETIAFRIEEVVGIP